MDKFDSFLRGHLLVLTEKEVNDFVDCWRCHKGLAGLIYGCSDCKGYIHKSCTKLTGEIQNFFHPCPLVLKSFDYTYTCNACFEHGSGSSYHCERCDFNMHVDCVLPPRPTKKSGGEEFIHHFTHWHPLTLVDQKKDMAARCSICENLFSGGSNSSVYGCEKCSFFLHNSCMINIPRRINHFLHPSCPLILLTTPSYKCVRCFESGSGLVFSCGKCRFQLGVKCALHPTVEYKGEEKILHFAHKHPLTLRENKESDREIPCRACGENCLDPCFGCASCDFFMHASCAELPERIHHPFHPSHRLTLSPLPPDPDYDNYKCIACRGMVDRLMLFYHCARCALILHAHCAKPKHTLLLKYGGHPHHLTFFNKTHAPIPCRLCNVDAQSCFLRCVACDFNMHLYCHPSAPKTIKHKYHLHPLALTKSPFEFELISPQYEDSSDDDEFYCDVCEEKRYGFESVYYCEECEFIAEVRCVLFELLPSLIFSKDQSNLNGRVISIDTENSETEATIVKLIKEIAELGAKEEPLETEIKKLQAMVEACQKKRSLIKDRREELEKDHLLFTYQLSHCKNKHPTEASTSEWLSAYLS